MRPNRIICTCAQCGASFELKASAVARGYGRFCNWACRRLGMQPVRIPRTCAHCGAAFGAFPSTVANGGGLFCSRDCDYRHRAEQRRPLADRFWAKVDKNGPVPAHMPHLGPCWVWKGAHAAAGYGTIDGRQASHVSWELHHGIVVAGNLVLHKCDYPPCVRPEHLFLGTPLDNMRDRTEKGRVGRVGRRPGSHLSEASLKSFREKRGFKS